MTLLVNATPAISGGQLLVRSDTGYYDGRVENIRTWLAAVRFIGLRLGD